jgi:hypothetical protein
MNGEIAFARMLTRSAASVIALVACALATAPAASAEDADPLALRQWLCTFFSTPHEARPELLRSAPVAFAPGSELQYERRQVGTQGGFAQTWTIGRRFSFWQTAYTRSGRDGRPSARFRLEVNGDRGLLLADDASVRVFFEGFPEPTLSEDEYTFRIVDPNEPHDEIFDRFVITFDIRSQDMSMRWSREEYQSYGQAFCER